MTNPRDYLGDRCAPVSDHVRTRLSHALAPVVAVAVSMSLPLVAAAGTEGTQATFCLGHAVPIVGSSADDMLNGTARDDVIDGGAANDRINGGGGTT